MSKNTSAKNSNLHAAKRSKNDEFYTQLSDIERELQHYTAHFKDKVVYCNCDDPRISNFFHYFSYNFERLGLKKLIATCYKNQHSDLFSKNDSEQAIYLIYEGDKDGNRVPSPDEIEVKPLQGDGDFRSAECIELLKQADIVVTNPPFSLFREYVAQLVEYEKKFLIVGNNNSITYKEIFPLIKNNQLWLGYNCLRHFGTPSGDLYEAARSFWFTNLEHKKRHEELILWKTYAPEEYPHYDNYNAVNVDKVANIPIDYDGVMGVPITFLDKYNPEQFEIIGLDRYVEDNPNYGKRFTLNGKETYARILIKHKNPQKG